MGNDNGEAEMGQLSLDACLELLANRQRRAIVRLFVESDTNQASIDEVIAEIVDDEEARTGERPGHDTIASTVYHVHLPKMAEAGILEYDSRNQDVRYRENPQFEEIYSLLQELE